MKLYGQRSFIRGKAAAALVLLLILGVSAFMFPVYSSASSVPSVLSVSSSGVPAAPTADGSRLAGQEAVRAQEGVLLGGQEAVRAQEGVLLGGQETALAQEGVLLGGQEAVRAQEGVLLADNEDYDPHKQVGHEHHEAADSAQWNFGDLLFYAIRIIYYAALLTAAGLMFWFSGIKKDNKVQRDVLGRWAYTSLQSFVLAALMFVFINSAKLMEGQEGGGAEWLRLFTETKVGQSWLAVLVLALLGFAAFKLPDPVKAVWGLLLTGAESWNGHALAASPQTLAVVLDFVHLICAALWVGGLLLLAGLWAKERKEAGRFAETFTGTATAAMAALVVTGVGISIILLPGWSSLFYTNWGRLLTAKTVLVLAVLVVGALLRSRARKRQMPRKALLAADTSLMGAIIIIVGLFTYMTPVPTGEAVAFHQMGETMHYTFNLTPNTVGDNKATLKVWLPEALGAPASVKLIIRSADSKPGKTMNIPLAPFDDKSYESFEGFTRTSYESERFSIADPGNWVAEIEITSPAGEVTVKDIPFRNY
ncbi:CopD family protein [Paenibacillus protaetiae]|uniref:Copper resistance protein CopC n=1 Tax=Paenibacillus protaetiae TaxID=2509456 RepID=A0A4P6EWR0_9BACL|nr:CopD family protein [Paenibacillus protaetiae]QAY66643.1 copper resistance protein CopC [Paenibacillus protaetiae]